MGEPLANLTEIAVHVDGTKYALPFKEIVVPSLEEKKAEMDSSAAMSTRKIWNGQVEPDGMLKLTLNAPYQSVEAELNTPGPHDFMFLGPIIREQAGSNSVHTYEHHVSGILSKAAGLDNSKKPVENVYEFDPIKIRKVINGTEIYSWKRDGNEYLKNGVNVRAEIEAAFG